MALWGERKKKEPEYGSYIIIDTLTQGCFTCTHLSQQRPHPQASSTPTAGETWAKTPPLAHSPVLSLPPSLPPRQTLPSFLHVFAFLVLLFPQSLSFSFSIFLSLLSLECGQRGSCSEIPICMSLRLRFPACSLPLPFHWQRRAGNATGGVALLSFLISLLFSSALSLRYLSILSKPPQVLSLGSFSDTETLRLFFVSFIPRLLWDAVMYCSYCTSCSWVINGVKSTACPD